MTKDLPASDVPFDGPAVVLSRQTSAEGVLSLTLRRPDGADFPVWDAGAHVDVKLPNGLVRQYSLCSDPGTPDRWRIGVLREASGRGGSAHLHDNVAEGELLDVHGPRNHFRLEDAESYLFIAGGIGVTPVLAMVAAAETKGAEWRLVYGGRTRASMAYVDELERYGDRVQLVPQDEMGLIDLPCLLREVRPGCLVYACGPEPLLAAVEANCAAWPPDTLRVERFSAKAQDPSLPDTAFDVVLSRAGRTVRIPAGTSILNTLADAGVVVESMCEEGTCGSCETNVISGQPDHRDSVLTPAEKACGESMMLCVSRCLGASLVLDL